MLPTSSSLVLFGLDLPALWGDFRSAWQRVGRSRLLAWLTPALPVQVLRADGTVSVWRAGRHVRRADPGAEPAYRAVEIDEELVLRKRLRMPDIPEPAMAQAAALEVSAVSPFAPDDSVWQWRAAPGAFKGVRTVEVVIASRKQVAQFIDAQRARITKEGATLEAWVFSDDGTPMVLPGWGEAHRMRQMARQRRLGYGLVVLAFCILAAMALTPSLQLRARSLQAISAFDALQRETAPAMAQREAFTRSVERVEALRSVLANRIDMLKLMAVLTRALPDDTYLQSVQTQDMKVTIHGLTADSASLMQTLGAIPGFKEVRAPTAATRAPGASAENFRLEVQLDPAVFALTAAVPAAAAQPSTGSNEAAIAGAEPAAVPSSTPAPQPPSSDTPPRKSRFTSGG